MAIQVDLSSYPKPAQPKGALEQATDMARLHGAVQGLESQALTIDKQKLDLINQQWGIINKELSTMANDKSIRRDQVVGRIDNLVKQGLIPPDMAHKFKVDLPSEPEELSKAIRTTLIRGQTVNDSVNFMYGQPGYVNTGTENVPVVTSPDFGVRQTGAGIPAGLTPAQLAEPKQWTTKDGQIHTGTMQQYLTAVQSGLVLENPKQIAPMAPQARGLPVAPMAPGGAPGATDPTMQIRPLPAPAAVPGASPTVPLPRAKPAGLPVAPPMQPEQPIVPNPVKTTQISPIDRRMPPNVGTPIEGPGPQFEQGKTFLGQDQELATQRLTQLKPLLNALPLIKDLRTGPTTELFNKIVAGLKANNIIPTELKDDPTAIRQVVNKYLAQYVSNNPSVSRSDAAQALGMASSPDAGIQINPALMKLVKNAIVLDRVQAARALSFVEGGEKDLSKYPNYRAAFPQTINEKAFEIDMMDAEEKKALGEWLRTTSKMERDKFAISLAIGKKLGFITPDAKGE